MKPMAYIAFNTVFQSYDLVVIAFYVRECRLTRSLEVFRDRQREYRTYDLEYNSEGQGY